MNGTTLLALLRSEMLEHNEDVKDVIDTNCWESTLVKAFINSHSGSTKFDPLYWWSRERVYFTGEYDGLVTVESVPRNPPPHA